MLTNTIHSERIKMLSVKSPTVMIVSTWIICVLNAILVGAFYDSSIVGGESLLVIGLLNIGIVIYMVLGALSMTSEYGSKTINNSFLATPRRTPVLIAKALVYGAVVLVSTAVLVPVIFLIATAVGSMRGMGYHMDFASENAVRIYWAAPIFASAVVVFAIGVGAIVKSSPAAISILVGWWFVIEQVVLNLIPTYGHKIAAFAPFTNGMAAMTPDRTNPAEYGSQLHWPSWCGLLYFIVWALAIFGVGVLMTKRRDA